jgi:hypothetical protein
MNIKSFFPALMLAASLVLNPCTKNSAKASVHNFSSSRLEAFNYVYQYVDGVLWVFVYDEKGNLVDCFPAE